MGGSAGGYHGNRRCDSHQFGMGIAPCDSLVGVRGGEGGSAGGWRGNRRSDSYQFSMGIAPCDSQVGVAGGPVFLANLTLQF